MIKIKIHQNFDSDEVIYSKAISMTPNLDGVWKNLQIVNDNTYDLLVIFNMPSFNDYVPEKTLVFESETRETRKNFKSFYIDRKQDFYYIHDTENHFNLDLWYHGLDFKELLNKDLFVKDKEFSVINSGLSSLPGHILRNNFITDISSDFIFDLFGRSRRYLSKKADGLMNYKYTFNCENDFEPNYFTEKILDGILCECLTFYDGCPNIKDFIDERSFIKIDLHDFEYSKKEIKKVFESDFYKVLKPFIKKEKKRLMNDFNPLNIIWEHIK